MNHLNFVKEHIHPSLPGVRILSKESDRILAGEAQEVIVEVEADQCIPLHTHSVDATMLILSGEAIVLSEDVAWHNKYVTSGDIVFFEKNVAHGFKALANGMRFLSKNDGIVDQKSDGWDIFFSTS